MKCGLNQSISRLKNFFLSFAFLFFIMQFLCIKAYAINEDYLLESKWENNPRVTAVELNKSSMDNNLAGVFEYYADNSNMCFYAYFHISETSLSDEYNNVRIAYTFNTQNESHVLSLDENGITDDSPPEEAELFSTKQSFSNSKRIGSFLSAVEYLGNEKEFDINITLNINGHNYLIKKDIHMELPQTTKAVSERKTTLKKTTTQRAKKEKITKGSTQKSTKYALKYSGTKKYSSGLKAEKSGNEKTTKFSPGSEIISADQNVGESKPQLSKSSKIILISGISVAGIGIIIILTSAMAKPKKDGKE